MSRTLQNWARMQTWEVVPAKILSADLDASRSRSGKGSMVYKAVAEYEYEYQGKKYRGTKVSRYFGRDNIGNFYENIYNEISRYENSPALFRCFVNPDAPGEAILYRKMRLGMLCLYGGLGGVLGGIGWGFFVGSLAAYIRDRRDSTLQKQFPDEPWKWRKDWIRGESRPNAGSEMFVALGCAIFAGIFSIPILLFIPAGVKEGNFAALLALIYPIIAAFIIKWAIKSILRWIGSRRAVLQLNSIPIRPGERLRGIIRTGGQFPESAEVRLELMRVKKRSGDLQWNRSTTTTPTIGAEGNTCIPVDLEIPEQTKKSKHSQVEWELRATSKIPGFDLDATFKIPVFQTALFNQKLEPLCIPIYPWLNQKSNGMRTKILQAQRMPRSFK